MAQLDLFASPAPAPERNPGFAPPPPAAHPKAEEAKRVLVEASRKLAAKGTKIAHRTWGIARSGRRWKAVEACLCPVGAYLVESAAPVKDTRESPRAAFADALRIPGSAVDALICGIDRRDDVNNAADPDWDPFYAAGRAVAEELGL